jgi:hypothetical protein
MATARDTARRKARTRQRVCAGCGKVEAVRKDNAAEICQSCSARRTGAKGLETIAKRKLTAVCAHCGTTFFTSRTAAARAKNHCCSRVCRNALAAVYRVCGFCGCSFRVARSVLSGKTNSSANYCSTTCYHDAMARPDAAGARGSRWRAIQREALRRHPWCARCGETDRLEVHHMIPWRVTRDNTQENLVVLCHSCHLAEDRHWSVDVRESGDDHQLAREIIRRRMVSAARV